jgi:hypothetical protein
MYHRRLFAKARPELEVPFEFRRLALICNGVMANQFPLAYWRKPAEALAKAGGDGGIRTLDRALQPYNGLANRRLQPLGHISGSTRYARRGGEPQAPDYVASIAAPGFIPGRTVPSASLAARVSQSPDRWATDLDICREVVSRVVRFCGILSAPSRHAAPKPQSRDCCTKLGDRKKAIENNGLQKVPHHACVLFVQHPSKNAPTATVLERSFVARLWVLGNCLGATEGGIPRSSRYRWFA